MRWRAYKHCHNHFVVREVLPVASYRGKGATHCAGSIFRTLHLSALHLCTTALTASSGMARSLSAAASLCAALLFIQSATAIYVAVNCGGNTTAEPTLPTYYDGVSYGPGPIYDPANAYTFVNKYQPTNPPTYFQTDRYYYGSSNHVTDWNVGHGSLNDTTNINVTNAYNGDDYLYITERYGLVSVEVSAGDCFWF
jgi:hypothetical protein